jgi:hypothetical protein
VGAAVRERQVPLCTVDAQDCHAAVADWTAPERIAGQQARLVEAHRAPGASYIHFAGLNW